MDLMLVEDNPTDRKVIETRLRRAFPHARISAADDVLQLRENLKRDDCDVVVTDYWLGWSDGLSVLQQVKERWPRARVILLTGNGGEEVVAEAFKLGLFRYLLKPDGFSEVVEAVKTAYESRRREDEQELMETIVNAIPDSLQCVDAQGIVTVSNPSTQRLYGYPEHQIVGRSFEMMIPEDKLEESRRLHEQALRGHTSPRLNTIRLRSDGSPVAVVVTLIPIRGAGGKISRVVHIASPLNVIDP